MERVKEPFLFGKRKSSPKEKPSKKPKGIAWHALSIEDRAKVTAAAIRNFVEGHKHNDEIGAIKTVEYPGSSEMNLPARAIIIAGGFATQKRRGKLVEVSNNRLNFPPHLTVYIPHSRSKVVDRLFGKPVLHVSSDFGMEIARAVARDLQERHGLWFKPTIRNWRPRE